MNSPNICTFFKSKKNYSAAKCGVRDRWPRFSPVILYKVRDLEIQTATIFLRWILGELGDFDPDEHRPGYLEDFRFVPFQNADFESEVEQYHKQHRFVDLSVTNAS